jgi:hypothetical protein
MFRNSRGLRDLAKHSHIVDCCKYYNLDFYNLDFIVISKTGKRDYSQTLLNWLSGGINFEWFSRPPRGKLGGLLIGVRIDFMKVLTNSDGEYHIKLTTRNRADNFVWSLVSVYGAA